MKKVNTPKRLALTFILAIAMTVCWYYANKHLHWFFAALVALAASGPLFYLYINVDFLVKRKPLPQNIADVLDDKKYWSVCKWITLSFIALSILKSLLA